MKDMLISKVNESIQNGYAITIGNTFGANACCASSSRFVPDGMSVYDSEIDIFNGGDLYFIPVNGTIHIDFDEEDSTFLIHPDDNTWSTIINV